MDQATTGGKNHWTEDYYFKVIEHSIFVINHTYAGWKKCFWLLILFALDLILTNAWIFEAALVSFIHT